MDRIQYLYPFLQFQKPYCIPWPFISVSVWTMSICICAGNPQTKHNGISQTKFEDYYYNDNGYVIRDTKLPFLTPQGDLYGRKCSSRLKELQTQIWMSRTLISQINILTFIYYTSLF